MNFVTNRTSEIMLGKVSLIVIVIGVGTLLAIATAFVIA